MFNGSLPPASTRADWSEIFEIFDDETGEPVDLSDSTIVFEVRENGCRRVAASIAIVDTGKFQAIISVDQMRSLCAGTYEAGCTLARDGVVIQEFIGSFPVQDGVVR